VLDTQVVMRNVRAFVYKTIIRTVIVETGALPNIT